MTKPTEILLNEPKVEGSKESIADLVRKMIVQLGEDPDREAVLSAGTQRDRAVIDPGASFRRPVVTHRD